VLVMNYSLRHSGLHIGQHALRANRFRRLTFQIFKLLRWSPAPPRYLLELLDVLIVAQLLSAAVDHHLAFGCHDLAWLPPRAGAPLSFPPCSIVTAELPVIC